MQDRNFTIVEAARMRLSILHTNLLCMRSIYLVTNTVRIGPLILSFCVPIQNPYSSIALPLAGLGLPFFIWLVHVGSCDERLHRFALHCIILHLYHACVHAYIRWASLSYSYLTHSSFYIQDAHRINTHTRTHAQTHIYIYIYPSTDKYKCRYIQ